MRHRKQAWVVAFGVLAYAAPAHALFGEENVSLMRIVWENIQQTLHLEELAHRVQQNLELMRETAHMARAATKVNPNVQALLKDPEGRLVHIVQRWAEQFPEVGPAMSSAYAIYALQQKESPSDALSAYHAGNQAFDAFDHLNRSSFEALAHATDGFGINDPHDRAIDALRTQYALAVGNLESLALSARAAGGISPMDAGVWTAQATSVAAVAAVKTGATLEQIARTQELQYAQAQAGKRQAQEENAKQRALMNQAHLKSWALRPGVGP